MKLFSKKSNSEPLKVLNEREIQERLYGKYHADSPKITAASTNTAVLHKVEAKSRLEPSFSSQPSQKALPLNFSALFFKLQKRFPWRFSGLLIGSVIGGVFVLQLLSFWMGTLSQSSQLISASVRKTTPNQIQTSAVEVEKKPMAGAKPAEEALSPQTAAPTSEAKPTPPRVSDTPKKKYYAVQVCTYFRESDARELTQELTALNFSAFYQHVSSGSQNVHHYLVFLGKEETYSAAEAKLEAFKKTKRFQSFPDSFIRSV